MDKGVVIRSVPPSTLTVPTIDPIPYFSVLSDVPDPNLFSLGDFGDHVDVAVTVVVKIVAALGCPWVCQVVSVVAVAIVLGISIVVVIVAGVADHDDHAISTSAGCQRQDQGQGQYSHAILLPQYTPGGSP